MPRRTPGAASWQGYGSCLETAIAHRDLDYYRWIGVRARSVAGVVERVEEGLPLEALERLGKLLSLDSPPRAGSAPLSAPRPYHPLRSPDSKRSAKRRPADQRCASR